MTLAALATYQRRRARLTAIVAGHVTADEFGEWADADYVESIEPERFLLREECELVGHEGCAWALGDSWARLLADSAGTEHPGDWLAMELYDLDSEWSTVVRLRYEPVNTPDEVPDA